jgi:hypothetical protein
VPTPEDDDNESVVSEELFQMGTDNIMLEGEIMKFKPGLSNNFVSRYVQISERAFRYFHSRYQSVHGKPLVGFRRDIITICKPYKVNKDSYLKKGSRIAQSGTEDALFDNMFELCLSEDYEQHF